MQQIFGKKGFTRTQTGLIVLVAVGLLGWAAVALDGLMERASAAEATNIMNLAAAAQGRQMMRKGRYSKIWSGLDAAQLATFLKKPKEYFDKRGQVLFTQGGGEQNPKSGFKVYFEEKNDRFFVVAERINWRYGYVLVQRLPEEQLYCLPVSGKRADINFCLDFMGVDRLEDLPADPRIPVAVDPYGLWN